MTFLHPEMLVLLPLAAAPVLIHLLNRLRYRVVRWAAIDFLLANERRAIRRARLRQILLMLLRVGVLAAAVLAIAQPVFRGNLAAVLGGGSQVAVLVDASASMSARDASGAAFERALALAAETVGGLPASTRLAGGTFAASVDCPYRTPIQDRRAVADLLQGATLTSGAGDVPAAICRAAEVLQRGGGGGTVWLLSDLQAGDWRAEQRGAWQTAREALLRAGNPDVLVTDVSPRAAPNFAVEAVTVSPGVLARGDEPTLTATVALHGRQGAVSSVALFVEGRQIDSRPVRFDAPGRTDVTFRLPPVETDSVAGVVELEPDPLPADNRFHFVLRAADRIPVLVAGGAASAGAFESAADFVTLALDPGGSEAMGRSRIRPVRIRADQLPVTRLDDYAAVFLTDVDRLPAESAEPLRQYLAAGGMVTLLPAPDAVEQAWNEWLPGGMRLSGMVQAEADAPLRVTWAAPNNPVMAVLPAEGLSRLAVRRLFRIEPGQGARPLATVGKDLPLLVSAQIGAGRLYVFAVPCRTEFSNLPLTSLLLLMLQRSVLAHAVERGRSIAQEAFEELRFPAPPGAHVVRGPDGRTLPVERDPRTGDAIVRDTAVGGFYRLLPAGAGDEAGEVIAAVNVPAVESTAERIDPPTIRLLLGDVSVSVARAGGEPVAASGAGRSRSAQLGFLLAVAALAMLLGEVLLAWSIGRPAPSNSGDDPAGGDGAGMRSSAG